MRTITFLLLLSTASCYAPPPPPPPGGGQPENICVTMVPSDFERAATAFGSILNLRDEQGNPRPATNEEITDATARWLGTQTADYERRQNMQSYTPPPFDPGSGKGYMNAAPPKPTATPKKK